MHLAICIFYTCFFDSLSFALLDLYPSHGLFPYDPSSDLHWKLKLNITKCEAPYLAKSGILRKRQWTINCFFTPNYVEHVD